MEFIQKPVVVTENGWVIVGCHRGIRFLRCTGM